VEDPSSFEDRDFVVNVADVGDVVDVVDEVALVVDVDVDYEDVDFDSVVALELVEFYIAIQTKNI